MAGSQGGGSDSAFIFIAIVIFAIFRRVMMARRGSKVSKGRAIAFSLWYLVFASLFMVSSFFSGVDPSYIALYAAIGAVAVYTSYRFSDRRIGFWRGADGAIYYRGAIIIYIIYVVALLLRIGIDFLFIGPQVFSFTPPSGGYAPLSGGALEAEIAVDCLLCFGIGLLIGRNIRVLKRYSLIMEGKEQVGDTPPEISYT